MRQTRTIAPGTPRLAPRKDIQGLRAVAVALVVLAHAGVPFLSGGYVGVDVFFVVSGFLIMQLLLREASRTGSLSLVRFYARRARRIIPASTLVLLVTSVVAGLTLPTTRAQAVVEDVVWSSLFAANIHFGRLESDYFELDRAVSPVQHYWSLAVEEQFYLLLPLVVLGILWLGRRRARAGRRFSRGWVAGVVIGLLTAASFAWSVVQTPHSPTTAYFSSLTRGWELGAGCLLALVLPLLGRLGRRARLLLATSGLAAILTAAVLFDASTPSPGYAVLLPVLGAAAVLAAGVEQDVQGPARMLTWRPVTWVGDLSYSIYLWHWPVLILGVPLLTGEDPEWLKKAVLVGVVVLLSMGSYHLVEQPFRRGRIPGARGRTALVLWPASVAAVVVPTLLLTQYQQQLLEERTVVAQRYYETLETSTGTATSAESIPDLVQESVRLAEAGAPIHFPLDNLEGLIDDHWAEQYACYATFDESTSPLCELGDRDADVTVVALGDSHMGMWLPALDVIGQADGFRVVPFVKWACPSIDVPMKTSRSGNTCAEFRAWTLDQVREMQPDAILLSNRVLPTSLDADDDELVAVWKKGLRSTIATMSEISPELRVFSDVPHFDTDPGECLSARDSTMATCTPPASRRSVKGIVATRDVVNQLGVPIVNVAPLTCFEQRCPLVVDQTVVYRDGDHVSVTWVMRLVDEVRELVDLRGTIG